MIERGEVNVSVRTALKLARALNLPLSYLFLELEQDFYKERKEDRRSGKNPGV